MKIDLSTLSDSGLIDLFGKIEKAITDREFPALVVETVTDDGETYEAVRCPVCGSLVSDAGDIYAVDLAHRWSPIEFDVEHDDADVSGGDTEVGVTLYYWHDTHPKGHAVSLPEGWTENWL